MVQGDAAFVPPYVADPVYVSVDVDAHYARARAAGATILSRRYRAEDLEGHRWTFATRL